MYSPAFINKNLQAVVMAPFDCSSLSPNRRPLKCMVRKHVKYNRSGDVCTSNLRCSHSVIASSFQIQECIFSILSYNSVIHARQTSKDIKHKIWSQLVQRSQFSRWHSIKTPFM